MRLYLRLQKQPGICGLPCVVLNFVKNKIKKNKSSPIEINSAQLTKSGTGSTQSFPPLTSGNKGDRLSLSGRAEALVKSRSEVAYTNCYILLLLVCLLLYSYDSLCSVRSVV